MLAGRRPFDGEDVTELLASVVKAEPVWTLLPSRVPQRLVRLIRRCLEKNPRLRLRDIGDAQFELTADPTEAAPASAAPPRGQRRERVVWVGALVLAAAVGAGGWLLRPAASAPGHVTRFSIVIPDGQRLPQAGRRIGVSPDGRVIVYSANGQLYRRTLDDPEPHPIPGTNENPTIPEFSPDGRSLIYSTFVSASQSFVVKRIPAIGGTALAIADLGQTREYGGWSPADASITWDGDRLVGSRPSGIWTAPATGGAPETLVTVDPTVEVASWPRLIDRGRHLLFTLRRVDQVGPGAYTIVVQPVEGGTRRVLVTAGRFGRPFPSGHLAYLRGGPDGRSIRRGDVRPCPVNRSSLPAT